MARFKLKDEHIIMLTIALSILTADDMIAIQTRIVSDNKFKDPLCGYVGTVYRQVLIKAVIPLQLQKLPSSTKFTLTQLTVILIQYLST